MHRSATLALCASVCIALGLGVGTGIYFSQQQTPSQLVFVADEGSRVEKASNPGARFVDETLELLYESRGTSQGQFIKTSDASSDYLTFSGAATRTDADTFRAHRLPDGTWRAYGLNTTIGIDGTCLKSKSSTDGVTFTEDDGCRYELTEDDNGRMGVYDFFNRENGDVVMLYIGDLMGLNNVRRAVSTDGGWTFTFDAGNVLDDEDAGGGARSYVDEKVIRLDDGTLYLIAMKSGTLYGFTSTDDGETFDLQGEILTPTDFGEPKGALHDPQLIELPDGRLRIFVNLSTPGDAINDIVSATTQ